MDGILLGCVLVYIFVQCCKAFTRQRPKDQNNTLKINAMSALSSLHSLDALLGVLSWCQNSPRSKLSVRPRGWGCPQWHKTSFAPSASGGIAHVRSDTGQCYLACLAGRRLPGPEN